MLTARKLILSSPLAALSFLIGDFSALFWSLVAAVGLDYVSGLVKALYQRNLKSSVMFNGGLKKLGVFFAVMIANIVEDALEIDIALRSITISYFLVNEALSVLENVAALGLPLPKALTNILGSHSGD